MAYSNIVLQPALHVWTCLNVYIVKYTFPWNQDLAINAPQVIQQISSLLYQRITLWWQQGKEQLPNNTTIPYTEPEAQ